MEYIFDDILEIKNGKNQKAVENPNGKYPIYGSGGVMGYADDYICEPNTVIVGRKGSINNPIFVEERFWNVDTAFGLQAKREKLNPRYLTMIIPARWFAGGKGLDTFRETMLSDRHLSHLVDFESSKDCFEGVDIAGGICYFLWDRSYEGDCKISNVQGTVTNTDVRALNEYPIFIRSNESVHILRKVLAKETKFVDSMALSQKPFGFRTYARGVEKPFPNAIKLFHSQGIGYVKISEVTKNADLVDKYKIIVGRLVPSNGELDVKPGDGYRVMTNTRILGPGEINSESYIAIGIFDTETEANNFNNYIKGKFPRFLLRQAISSVNINREVFKFVPLLDFTQEWNDTMLYERYGLTENEISFVESYIRPYEEE